MVDGERKQTPTLQGSLPLFFHSLIGETKCFFFLYIWAHTSNIRVHSNIELIYRYICYIRLHRSNIQWQEGNKHVLYHFSLDISFLHVSGSCLAHIHEHTHTNVPHTWPCTCATYVFHMCATHAQTNLSCECWCDIMWRCASNKCKLQ